PGRGGHCHDARAYAVHGPAHLRRLAEHPARLWPCGGDLRSGTIARLLGGDTPDRHAWRHRRIDPRLPHRARLLHHSSAARRDAGNDDRSIDLSAGARNPRLAVRRCTCRRADALRHRRDARLQPRVPLRPHDGRAYMNARTLLLNAYVYAVLAFILVPILIILPMAFSETQYLTFPPQGFTLRWFEEFFNNRRWMDATWFSLRIAALTAVSTAIIGTMATYALVRGAGSLGTIFQALLIGPIVVPHIALAVALYLFFQQS